MSTMSCLRRKGASKASRRILVEKRAKLANKRNTAISWLRRIGKHLRNNLTENFASDYDALNVINILKEQVEVEYNSDLRKTF